MQALLVFAQDEGSDIPSGSHGGRLHVRYQLTDGAHPVPNAEITETFAPVDDPYGLVTAIQRGSFRTDIRGNFDDFVAFSTRQQLPEDFRLLADQELFANGVSVARNRISWSDSSVMVRSMDGRRPPVARAAVVLR